MTDRLCPTCGGKVHVGHVLIEGRLTPANCPTCDGSGRITVEHFDRMLDGRRIRQARQDRGEGLRECAVRLGVRPSQLSDWETGKEEVLPGTLERITGGIGKGGLTA